MKHELTYQTLKNQNAHPCFDQLKALARALFGERKSYTDSQYASIRYLIRIVKADSNGLKSFEIGSLADTGIVTYWVEGYDRAMRGLKWTKLPQVFALEISDKGMFKA